MKLVMRGKKIKKKKKKKNNRAKKELSKHMIKKVE